MSLPDGEPGLNLRIAEPGEVPLFINWLESAARWHVLHGIDQWRPGSFADQREALERAQQLGELLIADRQGSACGGALLSDRADPIWRDCPRADAAYLSKLVIDRRLAGARLGATILRACERRAAKAGYGCLRLDCVASNQAMQRYYQWSGYYPRGIRLSGGVELLRHDKRLQPLPDGLAYRSLEAIDFHVWQPDQSATLLYLLDGPEPASVLLIHKQRGHGAGKINAPGGKLESGESPRDCAIRETREEVGLEALAPRLVAELRFQDSLGPAVRGFVFVAERSRGTRRASAEAVPFWCPLDAIPYDDMWQSDRLWLPWVFQERPFVGEFLIHDELPAEHRLTPAAG